MLFPSNLEKLKHITPTSPPAKFDSFKIDGKPLALDWFIREGKLPDLSIGNGNNHWKKVCTGLKNTYNELHIEKGIFNRMSVLLKSFSDVRYSYLF